jgi:3-hydroxy-9,10-secoandrosta-1,3,5(10)-triene-9,17-dione monooxygenase reductase component
MAVHADAFKHALGHFASGVTVVTFGDGEQQTGITVSAFCSVSLEPPYILICVNKGSSALGMLERNKAFVVNFLADNQSDLSNRFATRTDDKFRGVPHHAGKLQVPVLDHTLGYLECTVANQVEAGDHDIIVGQVENAEVNSELRPLLYYHGSYGRFC